MNNLKIKKSINQRKEKEEDQRKLRKMKKKNKSINQRKEKEEDQRK